MRPVLPIPSQSWHSDRARKTKRCDKLVDLLGQPLIAYDPVGNDFPSDRIDRPIVQPHILGAAVDERPHIALKMSSRPAFLPLALDVERHLPVPGISFDREFVVAIEDSPAEDIADLA